MNPTPTQLELEQRFNVLSAQWKDDTGLMSSVKRMVAHPAHQEIVRMGWDAVPLILCDLQEHPYHWFVALSAITHENPVPEEDVGYVNKMADAWLSWGRNKGLI